MTSNQRRPGFRLPWAADAEPSGASKAAGMSAGAALPTDGAEASAAPPDQGDPEKLGKPEGATATAEVAAEVQAAPIAPAGLGASSAEAPSGFMRDLVAAMRRVAEETRRSGLAALRNRAEEHVRELESDAEQRREELKSNAEADVVAVGAWADAEKERIQQEAAQRVAARRARLDQQLAAETTRAEGEAASLRERVAGYEQELDAYHAQLSDIADPAAFAAAAKRMPAPPRLGGALDTVDSATEMNSPNAEDHPPVDAVHPAEEEVLVSRLAELDAALERQTDDPDRGSTSLATDAVASTEPASTEILVKGLGSFGAITGFRQALANVDGIAGVSLSLGPTGEFVFRAIHPAGFDVAAAIAKLEGDAAAIERTADDALRVTLDRAR
ncbi:MAG: hypothetical protein M3406_07605 [Chloroflexota bacterium]|nr:hypothetical protein [Chloroflexota bacterium]